MRIKENICSDLKNFYSNLRRIYKRTLAVSVDYISFQVVFLIVFSFGMDELNRWQFSHIHNNILDYLLAYGR